MRLIIFVVTIHYVNIYVHTTFNKSLIVDLFAWQEVLQAYGRPAPQKNHWDSHKFFLVSGHMTSGLMTFILML